MNNQDIAHWLALVRMPGMGPITVKRALSELGDVRALFSASPAALQSIGLTARQIHLFKTPNWKAVDGDLTWLHKSGCEFIALADVRYPPLLREIHAPPLGLYVKGDVKNLAEPQLAIVGSRNPTAQGRELAEQFALELAKSGLVITSGLALGIDAASHRGALAGGGKTIAVMGTGLRHIYPAGHQNLAEKIVEQGLLISEFPPDTLPKANHFPARNRIISGLSLGVLVVEAAERSGSLITARCALEQNREVFAIPGSIHNPLARGCHQLLRQGAKLVETAKDVLEELGSRFATLGRPVVKKAGSCLSMVEPRLAPIFEQIGYEVTALDVIIYRSGLTAGEVSSMLLELELQGHVHVVSGGYVRTTNTNG